MFYGFQLITVCKEAPSSLPQNPSTSGEPSVDISAVPNEATNTTTVTMTFPEPVPLMEIEVLTDGLKLDDIRVVTEGGETILVVSFVFFSGLKLCEMNTCFFE